MHRVFQGKRTPQGCVVTFGGHRLNPRFTIRNHSPTGFEWGYGGSGPAQLALAMLVKAVGRAVALPLYQEWKWHFVALIAGDVWEVGEDVVRAWIEEAKVRRRKMEQRESLPLPETQTPSE